MVIYGEYLFLENMATGIMILHLVRLFSGVSAGRWRLVLGGALCGLYAFILFVPLGMFAALASKLCFSVLLVLAVFGRQGRKVLGKLVLLFYFLSFALGGASIGLLYFFQAPGVAAGGVVYMGLSGYLFVSMAAAAAYLLLTFAASLMKARLFEHQTAGRVTVSLLGQKKELIGLWDTGNSLREPVTGKPVFLMTESGFSGLVPEKELKHLEQAMCREGDAQEKSPFAARMSLIPYQAVGTEHGMLLGIRPDYIEIHVEGENKMRKDVVLGVYHGTLGRCGTGEAYEILLHRDAGKGGLL